MAVVQFGAHQNVRVHWTDKDKERMFVSDTTYREPTISGVVNKAGFRARKINGQVCFIH